VAPAIAVPEGVDVGNHGFDLFTVDLRCDPWKHPEPHAGCACVGDLTHMAICEPHAWRVIAGDENAAAEGWHDHTFPGWRDLPVVPARLRNSDEIGLSKAARRWVEQSYPASMQIMGAAIITERSGIGTRHVPGRSPWGGYDISSTALGARRELGTRRRRQPQDLSVESGRAATAAAISLSD
jgi:hypothetical protein